MVILLVYTGNLYMVNPSVSALPRQLPLHKGAFGYGLLLVLFPDERTLSDISHRSVRIDKKARATGAGFDHI